MTTYVIKGGQLVPKGRPEIPNAASDLPAPMLSRIEPFESPVTGKEISSWRERDRDMASVGAVDPRDFPKGEMKRGRAAQKREAEHARRSNPDFRWGGLPDA